MGWNKWHIDRQKKIPLQTTLLQCRNDSPQWATHWVHVRDHPRNFCELVDPTRYRNFSAFALKLFDAANS